MNSISQSLPPSVNFHLWKTCNFHCKFCFAVFDDDPLLKQVRGGLDVGQCRAVLDALKMAGAQKINFVGGEPTICPHLPEVLRHTREIGCVTSIVTNGARLAHILSSAPQCVDWVGLSVDSADEQTQAALGRGRGDHVQRSLGLFELLHSSRIRTKLNTVVTALNWQEDMSAFVLRARPERWKIFQVLHIEGQNDGKVEPLLITAEMFQAFVARHSVLAEHGVTVAAETNEDMTESYAMIDPLGRFFSNAGGRLRYSQPILEVGVADAFRQVSFEVGRFEARGGLNEWGNAAVPLTISSRS